MCAFFVAQKLGCERVAATTDQTFIAECFHCPIYAQLPCCAGPFDKTGKCAFGHHATITGHANMYSGGL
jgi:hypothetical protein